MSQNFSKKLEALCLDILRSSGKNNAQLLAQSRELYENLLIANHLDQAHSASEAEIPQAEIRKEEPKREETSPTPEPAQTKKTIEKEEKTPVAPPKATSSAPKEEIIAQKEEKKPEKREETSPMEPAVGPTPTPSAALHQKLQPESMNVGLNDRIAFVKKLFHGQTEDFNRVLSQINSFGAYSEAESFIETIVAPEYGWKLDEEFTIRFINLVRRKFGEDEISEDT